VNVTKVERNKKPVHDVNLNTIIMDDQQPSPKGKVQRLSERSRALPEVAASTQVDEDIVQ